MRRREGTAHIHAEVALVMGAPRGEVFEALTNEFYDWSVGRNAISHRIVKKEDNVVHHEIVRKFLGIKLEEIWKEELTPPSKVVMLITTGMAEVNAVLIFETESNGSTRVEGVFDGEVKGALAAVFGPFARRRLSHDMLREGEKFAKYKGWDFRSASA